MSVRSALAALLALAALDAPAALARSCDVADLEAGSRASLQRFVDDPRVPGASIAVSVGDGYRWSTAAGLANLELGTPFTTGTKVRIGSVSKIVTTLELLRLVDAGRIDLDRNLADTIPGYLFPAGVTVRRLTGHLAGIRHYVGNDALLGPWGSWERSHVIAYPTTADALKIFAGDSLVGPPGAQTSYSTYAWTLVTAVMEAASGEPFQPYMERRLPEHGLSATVIDATYALIPDRAAHYALDRDERVWLAPASDRSFSWAGGGFLSTAQDLARLGTRFRAPTVSGALLKAAFAPQRRNDGSNGPFGIGFMVGYQELADDVLSAGTPAQQATLRRLMVSAPDAKWHSGTAPGGNSILFYDPETDVSVGIVTNVASNWQSDQSWYADLSIIALEAFDGFARRAKQCRGGQLTGAGAG